MLGVPPPQATRRRSAVEEQEAQSAAAAVQASFEDEGADSREGIGGAGGGGGGALGSVQFSARDLEDMKKTFCALDKDGSNTIEFAELRMLVEQMGEEWTEEELNIVWQELDTDKSGAISWKEFLSSVVRFLFVEEGADSSSSSTPSASRASSPRLQSLSQPDYTGNLSSFLGGSDLLEEMSSAACTQGGARGRDGEVFTLNPLLFRGHR